MALILHPDRSVEVLDVLDAPGGRPTLEQMQAAVGGSIELVRCTRLEAYLVVNEEGLLEQLPYNAMASHLVSDAHGHPASVTIVGPAILAALSEIDDPPLPLPGQEGGSG